MDLYLERIGRPATTLPELHRAHLETVPFENLDIHLGEPISLHPDALHDKIVRRRRGGFCYELNGMFALLLEDLGHTVERLAARVFGGERLGPPYDHLALLVDGAFLVDVGFGEHATYPLEWVTGIAQKDPGGVFTLVEAADGDVDLLKDGVPQYRLERRPRALDDFAATCWYQQTWPESHFRKGPVCSRLDGSGRISISGRKLITTSGEGRRVVPLATDEEVLAAYREQFGIALPRVPELSEVR
ncbi:arylamine N-acetyltransferase [Actinoplanes sp. NPDC023714]|uniref:arylamine N-acetyltransferase family protein n=1 Tax=Actinoplanes sp. NPDC023714 TaxID=3154322 RepID=UPI0033C4BBA1